MHGTQEKRMNGLPAKYLFLEKVLLGGTLGGQAVKQRIGGTQEMLWVKGERDSKVHLFRKRKNSGGRRGLLANRLGEDE